jgi:TolA-binding protein
MKKPLALVLLLSAVAVTAPALAETPPAPVAAPAATSAAPREKHHPSTEAMQAAADKEKIKILKAQILQNLDERITDMQKMQKCISASVTQDDLRHCRPHGERRPGVHPVEPPSGGKTKAPASSAKKK